MHSFEPTVLEPGLSGIPTEDTGELNKNSRPSKVNAPLPGIPPTAIEDDQTLPDLVLDRGTATNVTNVPSTSFTAPELQQDLEAASVLLSLHDKIRDDTLDEEDEDDNTVLMPIGGVGAPIDVAPQEIKLDQLNVDAAIAEIVQGELNQEETEPVESNEQQSMDPPVQNQEHVEQNDQQPGEINKTSNDAKTSDDVPESEANAKPAKTGSLHMKGYGLKRKQTSRHTFRCSQCDSVKSSIQKLSAHHKKHHSPQMCGICGHTFTLAVSLNRHMYDHQELQYKCEHCAEAFHFESKLKTHKVKHCNKNAPSFQCMKTKCGKWFMCK